MFSKDHINPGIIVLTFTKLTGSFPKQTDEKRSNKQCQNQAAT